MIDVKTETANTTENCVYIRGISGFNLGDELHFTNPHIAETNIGERVQEPIHIHSEMGLDTFYVITTPKSCKISEIIAYKEIAKSEKDMLNEMSEKIRKYLFPYGEIELRKSVGMRSFQKYSKGLRELRFETERTLDGGFRIFLRYIDNELKKKAEKETIANAMYG